MKRLYADGSGGPGAGGEAGGMPGGGMPGGAGGPGGKYLHIFSTSLF